MSERAKIKTQNSLSTDTNSTYIHSVLLSFIPVVIIFILHAIAKSLFSDINSFIFFIISLIIFIAGNFVAYTVLSSIMCFKIYWRSSILTNTFLIGFILANQQSMVTLVTFGYYMMVLSFFHLSEFVFTALFNHKEVSTDSFLLNHSMEYGIAAVSSWLEFFIEAFFFPSIKTNLYVKSFGLALALFGELFRKLAMYTAGTNFNHYVQEYHHQDHVLVTNGVYKFVRHPSYFGWFYWSIGTQILLANPICTILYTLASWKFFKSRIVFEEFYLIKFFGKQYTNYQKKVPTGIPFVKGFVLVDETCD